MYNKGSYLIHFGILGQKWGVRRYQNEDGTLTEEGKKRYLANYDEIPGNAVYSHDAGNVYNNAVNRANQGIKEINKKWDKIRPEGFAGEDIDSLKANLEYTKEVRDMYQSAYREALAKDMGTDPSTLVGQKWLEGLLNYDVFDEDIKDTEKKISKKENKKSESKKQTASSAVATKESKSRNSINMNPKPLKDYSNTRMNQRAAISQAYADLEKIYPNFNGLSQRQQDALWLNYINESGLYKWV